MRIRAVWCKKYYSCSASIIIRIKFLYLRGLLFCCFLLLYIYIYFFYYYYFIVRPLFRKNARAYDIISAEGANILEYATLFTKYTDTCNEYSGVCPREVPRDARVMITTRTGLGAGFFFFFKFISLPTSPFFHRRSEFFFFFFFTARNPSP